MKAPRFISGIFSRISHNKEIVRRLLITLGLILVYRVLAATPLPGVDPASFAQVFGDTPFSNIFSVISGGRLDSPSLVAIGIAPYINASIIIQLLTSVIPKLEDLNKQGELGRRKINQYTRFLALPLAVLQAFMIYSILSNPSINTTGLVLKQLSVSELVALITSMAAGSIFLMWIGELITEHGVGNGASLIITFGIISSLPSLILGEITGLSADWTSFLDGNVRSLFSSSFLLFYGVMLLIIVLVFLIVFVTEAVRKLSIVYARRVRDEGTAMSYLPLRLNQAGVLPVIFAQSLLTFPQIISSFIISSRSSGRLYDFAVQVNQSPLFNVSTTEHIIVFMLFLIAFTYFYTFVVIKPDELAKNLQKSGAFFPGIRPGNSTINYLNSITSRLTLFGGIFLAVVSVIPIIVNNLSPIQKLTVMSGIGGTSLLIIVSTFLDAYRKIQSLKSIQNYEIFK